MKEWTTVYKRFGGEEYVIQTIMQPNNKVAVMKWFVRKRPFVGSTKVQIVYEGSCDKVSLSQGRKSPDELWQFKRSIYVKQIDKHIADRMKLQKELEKELTDKGEEVAPRRKHLRSINEEKLAPLGKSGECKIVDDVEQNSVTQEDVEIQVVENTAKQSITVKDVTDTPNE